MKATPLTEEFDFEAYQSHHGARALPLFRLAPDGKLQVFTARDDPKGSPGDTLVSLVEPALDEEAA